MWLALAAPVFLILAPLLYRLRPAGLSALWLIPIGVVLALIGLVLTLTGLVQSIRFGYPLGVSFAALALCLLVLAFPIVVIVNAWGTAPIHDVTTDVNDPPAFVDAVPRRAEAGALNPIEYEGPRVAALQQQSYPDIQPVHIAAPPADVFARAVAAVQAMHWDLISADAAAGRIEATDTTALFGFKDDVVVRIRPAGDGSRIDVRSLSRIGRGDLGANAKRIRAYLQRLGR